MDRLAVVGIVALFLIAAVLLSFFVFFVDPRYLNLSGFAVFYLTLFLAAWSMGYAAMRYARRNRRGRVAGLARKSALIALAITGGVLLSQLRWLSVYTVFILLGLAGAAEYFLNKK